MPLPSRPLGGAAPAPTPKKSVAPAELPEDFELPEIDFGDSSLPEVFEAPSLDAEPSPEEELELPSLGEVEEEEEGFPELGLPDDFPLSPVAESSKYPDSEAQEASVSQPSGPLDEDFDFDALFDDELENDAPTSREEDAEAAALVDDWDDKFPDVATDEDAAADLLEDEWDLEEAPTPAPLPESADPRIEEFDNLFRDEEENSAPQVEPEVNAPAEDPSWDEDFEQFMEELDKPESEEDSISPEEAEALAKPLKKGEAKHKAPKKKAARKRKSGGFANSLFNTLTAIPFLGIIFKPLARLANLGLAILALIPLLIIPVIIYFVAAAQVPGGVVVSGPDGALVSFAEFSSSNGEVSGVLTNSGDVIANVVPTFKVWSFNPFGGGSLFAFDEVASCEAPEISVEMDAKATAKVSCESTGGLFTKVSGDVSY